MRSTLAVLLLALISITSNAQERTAAGSISTQMTWSALATKVTSADEKADALNARLDKVTGCNSQGMLYVPGHADADANGCKKIAAAPSKMDIRTYNTTLCTAGGYHTVIASCKADEELLSCAGGPGDQYENNEFWVLQPDFINRRCIGYANQPVCYSAYYYGQIVVTAICYKP
jgi:hypothetical protein